MGLEIIAKMKFLLIGLLFCGAILCDAIAKKHHNEHNSKSNGGKIVGGHNATIQHYPYQAFLLLRKADPDDAYQCGGAIISDSVILSAAHCFADGIKTVNARIGSTDKFFGGEEYPGTFQIHENYNKVTKDYDLAYVKTNEKMTLDGVNAKAIGVIAQGTSIPAGSILKLSGWGATSEGGPTTETLMAVEVPTLSNEECNKKQTVTDRQFCGGYKKGGKDTCQGDSGGPAVLSDTGILAGVVSAGYGCARPNTPGIYTNITDSPLRSWILKHTGV